MSDKRNSSPNNSNTENQSISSGYKLFVSNLRNDISYKDIKNEFELYGEVIEVNLKRKDNSSNPFAFVVMKNKFQADKASSDLSKKFNWNISFTSAKYQEKENSAFSSPKQKSRSRSRSLSQKDNDKKAINIKENTSTTSYSQVQAQQTTGSYQGNTQNNQLNKNIVPNITTQNNVNLPNYSQTQPQQQPYINNPMLNPQYLQQLRLTNPLQYNIIVNQVMQQQRNLMMMQMQNKIIRPNIPQYQYPNMPNLTTTPQSIPSHIQPNQNRNNNNISPPVNIPNSKQSASSVKSDEKPKDKQPSNITINLISVKEDQIPLYNQNKQLQNTNPSLSQNPYYPVNNNQTSNTIVRNYPYNIYPAQIPQQPIKNDKLEEFISKIVNTKKETKDIKDCKSDITDTLSEGDDNFAKEYSLEEENLKHIWSGFITRTLKSRVGIDIYQLRYDCMDYFLEHNLNISHRISYDEILKRPILGVVALSPQNETQVDQFNQYIAYFNEKQKAGVVTMRNNITMYIIPNGEFSKKFYLNYSKKHMLGIIHNSIADPLNIISLPPPVISLSEKKKRSTKKPLSVADNESTTKNNLISYEVPDDNEVQALLQNLQGEGLLDQLTKLANKPDSVEKLQEIAKNPKLMELLQNPVIQKWLNKH